MIPVIRKRNYHQHYMPNFFNNSLDSYLPNRRFTPAVNVKEDEKSYTLELAVPGLGKEDINVEIEKDVLMISSKEKTEKTEGAENGYSRKEFGFESFCRNFTIPENADIEKIDAKFKNGILNVSIPKSKEDAKINRVIKIS